MSAGPCTAKDVMGHPRPHDRHGGGKLLVQTTPSPESDAIWRSILQRQETEHTWCLSERPDKVLLIFKSVGVLLHNRMMV